VCLPDQVVPSGLPEEQSAAGSEAPPELCLLLDELDALRRGLVGSFRVHLRPDAADDRLMRAVEQ
jgi:hypothetical protein